MATRAGVFLNRLVLTAEIDGADRFAVLSTYHVSDGKKGETYLSGAQMLDRLDKFSRGYKIEGNGDYFNMPETRLRINVKSLLSEELS